MKKRMTSFLLILTLVASIFAVSGCGKEKEEKKETETKVEEKVDEETKKLEKITLNEVAHSIFYAPMYVAIEEGYFEEEGIDLTLVTGFGADI